MDKKEDNHLPICKLANLPATRLHFTSHQLYFTLFLIFSSRQPTTPPPPLLLTSLEIKKTCGALAALQLCMKYYYLG